MIPLAIRWLVSDLDDTLLNDRAEISANTLAVLRRAQAAGLGVILASGRMIPSMRRFVDQVGSPLPFIACNGAQIAAPATGAVLHGDYIPVELAREVARTLEAAPCYFHYYLDDYYCFNEATPQSEDYHRSSGVRGRAVGRLSENLPAPVPKMLAVPDLERAPALLAALQRQFAGRLHITDSKSTFIEITNLTASKGSALKVLCGRLGADLADVVAFGDGGNDVSMLQAAGLGVAIGNANPAAKAAAQRVCRPHTEDGVARFIEELLFAQDAIGAKY